jgi:hypothetical protein
MKRGDNVLAAGSLVVALLAGIAGIILLVVACRLMGWFPDTLPGRDWQSDCCCVVAVLLFRGVPVLQILRTSGDPRPLLRVPSTAPQYEELIAKG